MIFIASILLSVNPTSTLLLVFVQTIMQDRTPISLDTPMYRPTKQLTRNQLEAARVEFERRTGLGKEDVRLIVATDFPRRIWETAPLADQVTELPSSPRKIANWSTLCLKKWKVSHTELQSRISTASFKTFR